MIQSEITYFVSSKTEEGGAFLNRDFTVLYLSSTDTFRKLKFLYYLIINKGLSSNLM